jgi:hypothetical protein
MHDPAMAERLREARNYSKLQTKQIRKLHNELTRLHAELAVLRAEREADK